MSTRLEMLYTAQRKAGWPASSALHHARTVLEWRTYESAWPHYRDGRAQDIHPIDQETDAEGRGPVVRLVVRGDDSPDLSYLDDTAVCTPAQRQAEYDRANRDGMWYIAGEYWTGTHWEQVDAVHGFIGDDWRGSGYDSDVMRATLNAALAHYATRFVDFESLAFERD